MVVGDSPTICAVRGDAAVDRDTEREQRTESAVSVSARHHAFPLLCATLIRAAVGRVGWLPGTAPTMWASADAASMLVIRQRVEHMVRGLRRP